MSLCKGDFAFFGNTLRRAKLDLNCTRCRAKLDLATRLLVVWALVVGGVACGEAPNPAKTHASPAYAHVLDLALTGNWIEVACEEGETGPHLPPPVYSKGIIKFGDHQMRWSSRLYDNQDCKALRPGTVAETVVTYTLPTGVETSDGWTAINLVFPGDNVYAPQSLYGLIKIQDGMLYLAVYRTERERPKSVDRSFAQAFAPM